ncbi:putative adhesin [Desulfosarcina sp.]|uniref:putative adhesin n=1 Tax=Desulfosarcina sp. TaxID=2027861 RepID=UPI0029BD01F2|nr:hypothetical protein [Desulfosarcina sp.]MDX2453946.1 hypothetical protein [Desulfosarcina sp.]MDX2491640.1 hypothetical protein [Desulfosarcina sp.]
MGWGKSEKDRIQNTLDYINNKVSTVNHQLLVDYVNGNSVFNAESISKALSLGFSRFNRHGTNKLQRHAIRGCILTRLAAESPKTLAVSNSWKTAYKTKSEAKLQYQIKNYLQILRSPKPLPKPGPVNVSPVAYGLSAKKLQALKSGLSQPKTVSVSTSVVAAGPPPGLKATMAAKKNFFEKISRSHLVLSGHGSWPEPWPKIRLKPQQKLRCYVQHYYPLGNDVGQLIDSRQFPAPVEEYIGGTEICDYTLHHKDSLKLLNHSVGDAQFITVNKNTLVSTFLSDSRYSTATFHFAACRVVSSATGDIWCPVHNAWEPYIQGKPLPCVLK